MKSVVKIDKRYKTEDSGKIIGIYQGPLSERSEINIVAVEDIPAFLPVISSGRVADSSNLSHRSKVVGISTNPILTGFVGNVQFSGEMINDSWDWDVGDLIFINQKVLSNIAPSKSTSEWSQQVGIAIRPNTIVIELKHSILF